MLKKLTSAAADDFADQPNLANVAEALRSQDPDAIAKFVTAPSPVVALTPEVAATLLMTELVAAIRAAETEALKPD